jgi:hypothetical protein
MSMDLLKKVELLLNAKSRAALPKRNRRSPLDADEAQLIAEIRKALGDVQAKERELAGRIQMEQTEADAAAERGDIENHLAHTRRLTELEHHLRQESTMAINLEDKLAQLEEKLALAQAAVDREAEKAAQRSAAADSVLDRSESPAEAPRQAPPPKPAAQNVDIKTRKSRLSD